MVKGVDRDLDLKLRFRQVLFFQGFWSPIEVDLSEYSHSGTQLKRSSLTDLDVLGIRYDKLFTPTRVVADCKSGRNVSETNRLFWLRGVKEFFGADQAYFLHPNIQAHVRAVAPKLGLRVLDEEGLSEVEKALGIATNPPLPLTNISLHLDIKKLWGIKVAKGQKPSEAQLSLKEVYSYLSYTYWYVEQHRNLLSVVERFNDLASLLEPDNPEHIFLAYSGLERFVHSLLETAVYVVSRGTRNVPLHAKHYIYGGPLALKDKERLFELVNQVLLVKQPVDPDYLDDVTELLGRMLRNPDGATDMLRYISVIYLWCIHMQNATVPPIDSSSNTAAIVLARDAAQTFTKATGIRESLYSALLAL